MSPYLYIFQVYTGRNGGAPEVGQAQRVVKDLTRDLVGHNHHVVMDNFFSSPDLFRDLHAEKIYATGTCRTNRRGWPDGLSPKLLRNQGDYTSRQCGVVTATIWKDKKQVSFLSTAADPTKLSEVRRKQKDGTSTVMLAPEVVNLYGKYMGGVDHGDQLRTQYSSARKSNKWWTYLYYFGVDTAIANALILMKASPNHQIVTRGGRVRERTQLEFRQALATQLIGELLPRTTRVPIPLTEQHWPEVSKGRRCKQCAKSGIRRETNVACAQCCKNLCVGCFKSFHIHLEE
jgi:hypothetical protein